MPSPTSADYEALSPYLLLRHLPQLACNRLPACIKRTLGSVDLKPWELLEEGVFFFFRTMLMLDTIRLGKECLFKREPEGIVLVNREHDPFALMYECKSRKDGYRMSSDDALRYKNYIRKKRQEVRLRYYTRLSHFVIVASSFEGDTDSRLSELECEGVVVCMITGEMLTRLYDLISDLPMADLQLLPLERMFCRGVVEESKLAAWLE